MIDLVDLTPGMDAGDRAFVRRVFCALVTFPAGEAIRSTGAGQLSAALELVGGALVDDDVVMPAAASAALEVGKASTFAEGAAAAIAADRRLRQAFADEFVRRTGGAL